MILLHCRYLSPRSEASSSRSLLARTTMDQMSTDFLCVADRVLSSDGIPVYDISPLTFHWAYRASLHCMQSVQENRQPGGSSALETMRNALRRAGTRWRSAGTTFSFHSFSIQVHVKANGNSQRLISTSWKLVWP
jgi:hypothetical protein